MKVKRHHRKTLVTDLYTVEHKDALYYFTYFTNKRGLEVGYELRTQDGKLIKDQKLVNIFKKSCVDIK